MLTSARLFGHAAKTAARHALRARTAGSVAAWDEARRLAPSACSEISLEEDSIRPFIQPNAYLAPSATLIGSVAVNDKSAILNNAVLRGDLSNITVGAYTVVSDNCVIAPSSMGETNIGDYAQIGPGVTMTEVSVGSETEVGACCVLEDGASIGDQCVVEPHSLVEAGTNIPNGEVWGGRPATYVRSLSDDEKGELIKLAEVRYAKALAQMEMFTPHGQAYLEKEKLVADGVIDA